MNRIEEIEELLKNANVSPDAFAEWLDHSVTKRMLLEVELQLLDARQDYSAAYGATCESIALASVKNAAICDTLETVLSWKPNELRIEE